jgi:hypothetical protein
LSHQQIAFLPFAARALSEPNSFSGETIVEFGLGFWAALVTMCGVPAENSPAPRFFVNVASKGVSMPVSPLDATLARTPASVAFKRVRGIPRGLREMASGEGREVAWSTCGKSWTGCG